MVVPVTLVYVPNSNFLLGTFDTTDFAAWWIADGFGDVEYVKKGIQTYAEIHLAICKMMDGSWSVFQSKDYAQSWTEVYNTSYEIFDIVRINYGWTIINTGDGFYESTDAGTNWAQVCALPAAPIASAIANAGNGDILICTDGRYIWRSTDIARTWSVPTMYIGWVDGEIYEEPVPTGDMQVIKHQSDLEYEGAEYTGPSIATVAAAGGKVSVAHGPFCVRSVDFGEHFQCDGSWSLYYDVDVLDYETNTYHVCFPPREYVYDNLDNFLVSQILVSKIDGFEYHDCTFVVKTDDLMGADNSTLYQTWDIPGTGSTSYNIDTEKIYPTDGATVKLYRTSTNTVNKNFDVVFTGEPTSTQARIDLDTCQVRFSGPVSSEYYVRVRVRTSPGELRTRLFKLFSGEYDGTTYNNFWYKYVFSEAVAPGELTAFQLAAYDLLTIGTGLPDRRLVSAQSKWSQELNKLVPSLKYSDDGGVTWTAVDLSAATTDQGQLPAGGGPFTDNEWFTTTWVAGQCNNDTHLWADHLTRNMSYDMDWLKVAGEHKTVTYDADCQIEGAAAWPYRMRSRLEATHSETYDGDAIVSADHSGTYEADRILEKSVKRIYRAAAWVSDTDSSSYQAGALVYSTSFPEINMPQAFRLAFPWSAERGYPYDSREE